MKQANEIGSSAEIAPQAPEVMRQSTGLAFSENGRVDLRRQIHVPSAHAPLCGVDGLQLDFIQFSSDTPQEMDAVRSYTVTNDYETWRSWGKSHSGSSLTN